MEYANSAQQLRAYADLLKDQVEEAIEPVEETVEVTDSKLKQEIEETT